MPVPRREDPARRGDFLAGRGTVISEPLPSGRPPTPAEAQRRYRQGHRAPSKGPADLIWDEPPRNGLPFRPYVYRGSGCDAITGEEDEV